MPFLPGVIFEAKRVVAPAQEATPFVATEQMPQENILEIPKLGMREIIHDGPDAASLDLGAWRRPHTSTPDAGSNTVVVGHRFTYTSPQGVFYHLDKIAAGDELTIFWAQQKYTYTVAQILVVPPSAIEVEAPTETAMLTLYTCTPLWSGHERLVIQATLKGQDT